MLILNHFYIKIKKEANFVKRERSFANPPKSVLDDKEQDLNN